jgi:RNA polymerase sigma-70 factor (ECF subfamily)
VVGDVGGDPVDAAEVYRTLAPQVLGYLRGQRVVDPEDLLGEVFLQVSRDLHRFEGDRDDLRRWVFTIARHRAIDGHRRRERRPEVLVADRLDHEHAAAGLEDPVDEDLVEALTTLTHEQREVVLLRFVADLSLEQVAGVTGRSVGAVKAMQHRALEQLRTRLDGDPDRPEA